MKKVEETPAAPKQKKSSKTESWLIFINTGWNSLTTSNWELINYKMQSSMRPVFRPKGR